MTVWTRTLRTISAVLLTVGLTAGCTSGEGTVEHDAGGLTRQEVAALCLLRHASDQTAPQGVELD